jgi:hypothetical protein
LLLAHATSDSLIDDLETEYASELSRHRDLAAPDYSSIRAIPPAQLKPANGDCCELLAAPTKWDTLSRISEDFTAKPLRNFPAHRNHRLGGAIRI